MGKDLESYNEALNVTYKNRLLWFRTISLWNGRFVNTETKMYWNSQKRQKNFGLRGNSKLVRIEKGYPHFLLRLSEKTNVWSCSYYNKKSRAFINGQKLLEKSPILLTVIISKHKSVILESNKHFRHSDLKIIKYSREYFRFRRHSTEHTQGSVTGTRACQDIHLFVTLSVRGLHSFSNSFSNLTMLAN